MDECIDKAEPTNWQMIVNILRIEIAGCQNSSIFINGSVESNLTKLHFVGFLSLALEGMVVEVEAYT